MDALVFKSLRRLIKTGSLTITTANGIARTFGDGCGFAVAIRFRSATAQRRVLLDPELHLGEAFVDGDLLVEQGTITQLLELLLSQDRTGAPPIATKMLSGLRFALRRLAQKNDRKRSRRNVAHHYDLSGKLYKIFLDSDMQYSCAYFENADMSLEEAQQAKKRHIAAKLRARHNARILDIGCGWGGLALYLADTFNARVTGITLSAEQLEFAKARAAAALDPGRLDFRSQDYRDVTERFDRIVSVGMFEHVGVNNYDAFFRKCRDLLDEDGVLLLHSIGRSDAPGYTNPWIAKYIFPGGYIPALSEVLPAIERAGLVVTDIEILRLHYAETLRHWRERFLARRTEVVDLFDERFARLWEYYLGVSELAFRYQGMMVFQIQIARRQNAVPLTRNYIQQEEHRLQGVMIDQPECERIEEAAFAAVS
ncbi:MULTISPECIES: cyclopropane-fatty-acyl-phospholipid synthase family protein [Hyphomicrobiales]|uniref:SAM-dependent methyltransferase n=1 Tax=Hyphomicrobiales TaxID=356 RepID=UPI0004ADDD9C|nr:MULTISPECIES: cyclopropane-fatty-acyl-phospholipid synthase family protein [Hyphomicrobiales]CAH1663023.1 Cyclopropane-fatty-acyl-phospholipid synthase [Hyphomicrobiales bacterium]MBS7743583.1 class I SAM-dependent methyltransferase [Chelatococcus sp. HY11]MBX3546514.1 class I SAM-dependent methyltransferase [Chelatococcus sp.]MCO5079769.1 cyclopropane-fatty-acyl-phospholipid synthase family protein [Chelatococcus sp.]MCO5153730.1 cyclopropane-fatty-acyl-phospholipid synthase family protein